MARKFACGSFGPFGAGCVLALIAASAPSVVLGYILPAEAIFSAVARRRSEIAFNTIVAEGSWQQGEGAPVPVWEAIREGKAHRIERKAPGATQVLLTVGSKHYNFQLGTKAPPPAKVSGDLIFTFLGNADKDGGGQRGMTFLKQHGIDDNEITLGRMGKRIAYVIGAKPWETNKPQLWIDKEMMVPLRLIEVEKPSGSIVDTRLIGIGSATTNEWFPQRIEVWRDGKLVETTTYTSARINEEVSEDLFRAPS